MGKRRRRLKRGGPRKQYTSTEQHKMLDLSKKRVFKYHLTRLVERSEMQEDHQQTFIANVLGKASQNSIRDAKEYVGSIVEEGLIEQGLEGDISKLLDRFTKRR